MRALAEEESLSAEVTPEEVWEDVVMAATTRLDREIWARV
jgi:hypothetical protein